MRKNSRPRYLSILALCLTAPLLRGQSPVTVHNVQRIFVEPMPTAFDQRAPTGNAQKPGDAAVSTGSTGFDQYLIAAITKELGDQLTIVTSPDEADAVLRGRTDREADGTRSTFVRRALSLDLTTGTIELVSKDGKTILWASEAGDKSVFLPVPRRTGQRKVAERLAKDLRKAMFPKPPRH